MKKKIFFHTDFTLAKTGFGRCAKALATYLYKTGKYELVNFCCGINYSNPVLSKTPWKSLGVLPDSQQEIDQINRDPVLQRDAGYGSFTIDKVIKEERPDVYIGVQDIWAFPDYVNKYWWNQIPCVIWTTLDSLPILPTATKDADKINNYWVWSNFAEKELHNLGYKHVKTIHGPLEDSLFFKLSDAHKLQLRKRFSLDPETFIIGFVFRNQLRKSVPNLLEGYSLFRKSNPSVKSSKLLLHTSYSEGWNINKLAAEYNVKLEDIITTYVCRGCGEYDVRVFNGEEQNCQFCGRQKCQFTTHVGKGVSEKQLNEIYNLMDVYCHPFTSGGQEIPIQEAKLAELITLVTNYSCGEELCEEEAHSLPLDWAEYREHGTEFRKASTLPSSIAKQLAKVFSMEKSKKNEMGKKARTWTLENYSINSIGKKIEKFLDEQETTNYDFEVKAPIIKDPKATIPEQPDDAAWVKSLYKFILKCDVADADQGFQHWMNQIKNGMKRSDIENYFRQVAEKDNASQVKPKEFSELLDSDDEGKRLLYCMPESIGDVYLSTSLFESIKETYPEYNLYVATKKENFEILDGNPYVHKVIEYVPQMDNLFWLEGIGGHKGYFQIAFLPHIGTQRMIDYVHNGLDKIAFDNKYALTR